jgi:hypothetical protein
VARLYYGKAKAIHGMSTAEHGVATAGALHAGLGSFGLLLFFGGFRRFGGVAAS